MCMTQDCKPVLEHLTFYPPRTEIRYIAMAVFYASLPIITI